MKFIKKPISLPANYRFFYQLSALLLILNFSCRKNNGASTLKLQILAWALRDSAGLNSLLKVTKLKEDKNKFQFWALDPALNRAIEFALADGFISLSSEKFFITPTGESFLVEILKEDVFAREKEILKNIGTSVTEAFVDKVLKNKYV